MSKVSVDRELLERAMYANDGKELIAAILAQPAEAEGVEVVAWANPADLLEIKKPGRLIARYVIGSRSGAADVPLVRQSDHLAALSAVTAERDLAVQGGLQIIAERDQLRAEVEASRLLLEQCNEVIAEDGGVYIELRAFLAGTMPASDVIALLRDSAMSAKEA